MRLRNGVVAGLLGATLAGWQLHGLASVGIANGVVGPLGDNLAFVWNTWWAAHALRAPAFSTRLLFAPWGTSLVLHTHTMLPSAIGSALPGLGPIAATNVIVALHVFLNGVCAFVLAGRVTTRVPPRALAALAFAWSPFIGAHLAGHFNLIAAWVLPLALLVLFRSLETGRVGARLATGLVLGAIAYVDYYLVVYTICLALLVVLGRSATVTLRAADWPRWQRTAVRACLALLAIDVAVLAAILITGGGRVNVGGRTLSFHGTANPAAAAGMLILITIAVAIGPRLRLRVDRAQLGRDAWMLGLPAAVAAVVLSPLMLAALSLWRTGGYVSQTYFWRSAPAGIDLATLVLGNPTGELWRSGPATLYARLDIDAIERVAWIGPGVLVLAAGAIVWRWNDRAVKLWTVVAVFFGFWALGPRLLAFGRDLQVFLPAVLLRYVPLAANARIPGRAMVVVYLAAAMLAAIGFDALTARGRRTLAWSLAALLLIDYLPRTPEVYRPDHPVIYDTLAQQAGAGALCELPMGLRDGFGETGRLDMRTLYYQTLHGRAMTGGFVARLDPRIVADYQRDPVLGVLLRLSGGALLAGERVLPPTAAGRSLQSEGIRFVMLNRGTSPPDLTQYVESALPLRTVQADGERTLYEVVAPVNASVEPQRR
jgi:hypothetical protein